jgi:hypothetical protein
MAAKGKYKQQPVRKTAPPPARVSAAPKARRVPLTATMRADFWKTGWIPGSLLMLTAMVLYHAATGFGYILDDEMVVWKNSYVLKGFSGLGDIFASDSFLGYFKDKQKLFLLEGGRYRPLSLATFALEVGIWGEKNPNLPMISHTVNILLYGLTAVMLLRIMSGLFPLGLEGKWYFSVGFLSALVFVLHPLHSECVANIKGRDEILALMGCLGALYATCKYFDTENGWWLWGAAGSLLLGMLAKENALTFVVVVPLMVYTFTTVPRNRVLAASVPLLVSAVVFILIRYNALGFMVNHGKVVSDLMNDPFLGMSIGQKLATIFLTLGWYLKLLILPFPLTHDYYPYHVPKVGWEDWRALVSLLVYAFLIVWALRGVRHRKIPAMAILYWVATLSIVSNLVVSVGSFMNERFAYTPSVAFAVLFAWLIAVALPERIGEKPQRPYVLGGILLLGLVGLFGWVTLKRVPDWKDAMALNKAAIKVSYNSARSHVFYVTSLYEDIYLKTKDKTKKQPLIDTMDYHIKRAIAINPDYASAWVMQSAIVAAQFDQDNQLDKFFNEMSYIAGKIPYNNNFRAFLDQYMKFLDGSTADKYTAFCHRLGYEFYWREKRDAAAALHFLQFGLDRQTADVRIMQDMAEIYNASGDAGKAAQMQTMIRTQQ